MVKTKTERNPALIRDGENFIISQIGFKTHELEFLGKVSRLIKELDVGNITPIINENHINVDLRKYISKSRLDELLEKYRISTDYDREENYAEARLHNGGDFYVYVRPVGFEE